ncbi:MAG: OadG family transporter subunit [Kiritimatiellia bacterium]|mgnify:FL=1|jgi:oxaloacetate decarboxylase gamma subunit|nr:OadG family transporter subunit [Kiritimatiellia bacterium]
MAILLQGLVLLVSGMGIVFLFLALLVWVMNRSAAIIPRFNHILPDEEPKKKTRPAAKTAGDDESALIAVAIAAARARAA